MYKYIVNITLTLSLGTSINASTLEELIIKANTNNHTIKKENKYIQSIAFDEDLSLQWKDPVLGFGVNNIQFSSPLKRDMEATQAQYISYSQVIPTNSKLEIKKEIVSIDAKLKKLMISDYKLKLKSLISKNYYEIIVLQERENVLVNYINSIKKQKRFARILYNTNKIKQGYIVGLDIKMYKLRLKRNSIKNSIENKYLYIENLIYESVEKINEKLDFKYIEKEYDLKNHPVLLSLKLKEEQENQKIKYEKSKEFSDIKLTVSYANRQEFNDFISFNVSIPLNVNDNESINIDKLKINKKILNDELYIKEESFKSKIKILNVNIQKAQENINMITKRLLPLNYKKTKLARLHNSTNQMSSLDTYSSLNNKYELYLLRLDEYKVLANAMSSLKYYESWK